MSLAKDVLFYSNYCLHSKELLMKLNKLGMRNIFLMVCVEQHRASIPRAIDRVPTIVTSRKLVLQDDDVDEYVDLLAKEIVRASQPQKSPQSTPAMSPQSSSHHAPEDLFSHTDAGFSYLDDGSDSIVMGGGLYGVYGEDQRIDTPDDEVEDNDATMNYERYKASRDADVNIIKKMA